MILALKSEKTCAKSISQSEYEKLAKGLSIRFGLCNTPFGEAFIGFIKAKNEAPKLKVYNGKVCVFEFIDNNFDEVFKQIKKRWALSEFFRDDKAAEDIVNNFFEKNGAIQVLLKGTKFQIQVWQALLKTKKAALYNYCEIANMINRHSATRAVASAIAKNQIAIIIPCHRVIKKDNTIGQYRWNSSRKKAIIDWEKATY